MKYLELEELVIGSKYTCVPYDNGNFRISLVYVGNGDFRDDSGNVYTVYGEIRYVLS